MSMRDLSTTSIVAMSLLVAFVLTGCQTDGSGDGVTANAAGSDFSIITCEGTKIQNSIMADGKIETQPPRRETRKYKVSAKEIDLQRCAVATDAMLICKQPKKPLSTSVPGNETGWATHAEGSKMLDKYSRQMLHTQVIHSNKDILRVEITFDGNCH